MNYLISGNPRTRSAWLCALMNAHHSLCYHDAIGLRLDLSVDAGIADPAFACLYPFEPQTNIPRIYVFRDDWRESLELWCGMPMPEDVVDLWDANCASFERRLGTIAFPFEQLDDDHAVKEIIEICTKQTASMTLIQIFQALKIEQHLPKARSAWQILQLASAG